MAALRWMEAAGQRAAGAGMGPGWCCRWVPPPLVRLARAQTHSPVPGTVGRRDAAALQDVGMSPGGGCSRAVKPQRDLAGLACVCPAAELPAQPLMGKACGRTSGSERGNTQSIVRASGFLHRLTPDRPQAPPPALPPTGPRVRGKGRRSLQWAEVQAGQRAACEPQQELPTGSAAPAGRGGRRSGGFGWQHTAQGAAAPGRCLRQHRPPRLSRHHLGIASPGALVPSTGVEGVDTAPGQSEGSGAFGSLGAMGKRGFSAQSPRCCRQHPAPAPTGTRRAGPSEAVDREQPWGRAEQMPANPSHLITVWSCCYL